MKLFKFENYEHYKKEQVKANVRKLEWTWIQEDTINKIKTYKPDANKILCHGVRNAKELEFFSTRYIGSEIIGTEISHTAKQFQNVVHLLRYDKLYVIFHSNQCIRYEYFLVF